MGGEGRDGRHVRMSGLDGWIDVCRTGVWRDASNREVPVDDAMLDGLVDGYASQDPAPVVVGHPSTDAPAFGRVEGVRRIGDRLQAKLRDIAPQFREAVEQGFYSGRSIAIADGKLRHLGFLGGRAPAVPGLSPTQFAAPPETVLAFSSGPGMTLSGAWSPRDAMRSIAATIARLSRGMRERIIAAEGIERADESIPAWDIEHVQRMADELEDDAGEAATYSSTEEGTVTRPTGGAPAPLDEAALAARAADLDAREARLAATEAAAQAAARVRNADTALEAHISAGCVLPAERASLAALLASLPDDETTITFAAAEGNGEVQEKPRAVLERFLGALPQRVRYGELAGGAIPPPPGDARSGEDNEAIAVEARTLMSEAASRGETLTAKVAVDTVRRKRGLDAGGAS